MPFDQTSPSSKTDLSTQPDPNLRCAQCDTGISHDQNRIAMKGGHEHTVFNPAGMVFHLGCFDHAHNLQIIGAPSPEFSWFKNYDWQIVTCANCHSHLGWRFSGANFPRVFFGLILKQLKEG